MTEQQNRSPINWTNETIKLVDLVGKDWKKNPRTSTDEDIDGLQESFDTFGQVETVAIGPDGEIYNGHQRIRYLLERIGDLDTSVDVRRASRKLTEQERRKLTIFLHAGATGRWDWKKLQNWDRSELEEFGMGENYSKQLQQDYERLNQIFGIDPGENADATDGSGGGAGGEQPPSDGSLLELLNVTIDEPDHKVLTGQVWKLGKHILVCANVLTDWNIWQRYLSGDCIFAPYPGPFVPLSKNAEKTKIVMVQPDPYIAGHILDRYDEVNGKGSAKLEK